MESEKLLELQNYRQKLKGLLSENIVDILLFGSLVKGGMAKDIDLAVLVRVKTGLAEIKKKVREQVSKETDIQIIDLESIYTPLWLTLIKEGFSLRQNEFLSKLYKIKPIVLYKYSLQKLTAVQKVQFERGLKTVLGKEGEYFTRSVVIIPLTMKNIMMEFLKSWNIYYESRELELLPILRKEEV